MKMVDVKITRTKSIGGKPGSKGGVGNIIRAKNGQFTTKKQTPRFKVASSFPGDEVQDAVYDRVSKRRVAWAASEHKAQEIVTILNKGA
jgi:hypothetical protein